MICGLKPKEPTPGAPPEKGAPTIDWITIPRLGNKTTKDILDLGHARQILDQHHYGLTDLKERILEYLSVLILNEQKSLSYHAPILLLVGLVGTGKTTLAKSIAEALGRKFVRIPFGGMGSALICAVSPGSIPMLR